MKRVMFGLVILVASGLPARGDEPVRRTAIAYPVADLIVPRPQSVGPSGKPVVKNDTGQSISADHFEPLIELLTETVAPGSWSPERILDARGNDDFNTIIPFFLNLSLIVRATPEVHDQIEARLAQLRRLPAVRGKGEVVEPR